MESVDKDVYNLARYRISRLNGRVSVGELFSQFGQAYKNEFYHGERSSDDENQEYEREEDTANENEEGHDLTYNDLHDSRDKSDQEISEIDPNGNNR